MAAGMLLSLTVGAQNFNMEFRSQITYTGQTLANVCGYWQNGREYALLGGSKGMIIVDITDPANPQQLIQLAPPEGTPNNSSLWKEIKIYKHYAYVVTEAGGGVQIVDLANLPATNLSFHNYKGDGAIANQLTSIHALHIDVTKGYLYLYGSKLYNGGAVVVNLEPDPYNPKYAGKFDQLGYIHDGYVDNDTLYGGHIYAGQLSMVDMTDKSNPTLLGTVETPAKFTHNSWITSDRKHVLTTDETTPSFLASFDVSDPSDMKELDRVSLTQGTGSVVHNTHILNDYAVTSWYTDGVAIVDAHRPHNLVVVGHYDTNTLDAPETEGCWGAFPFFPSGTIITTDIEPAVFNVLTPTYKRACYLEGKVVKACDGHPLAGATVKIIGSSDPQKPSTTKVDGLFYTGQVSPGLVTVVVTAPGYVPKTINNVNLSTAEVTPLTVEMEAIASTFIAEGLVLDATTNAPVANAAIKVFNTASGVSTQATTDANGHFATECIPGGVYDVSAAHWAYYIGVGTVSNGNNPTIKLERGYYDDFVADLGWTTESAATTGDWVRDIPIGTYNQNAICNPETDAPNDTNDDCYMTGNGGGDPGVDDVDGGTVTLTSPAMQLAGYQDATLTFYYWFYNGGGTGTPNDKMEVNVLNGSERFKIFDVTQSGQTWRYSGEIHLANFTPMTNDIHVEFIAHDDAPGHLVEGGVDIFKVVPGLVGVHDLEAAGRLFVSPNPSTSEFVLRYEMTDLSQGTVLEVRNTLGQLVYSEKIAGEKGALHCGADWLPGVYFATLRNGTKAGTALKLVKS